jgi:hypothetical protein
MFCHLDIGKNNAEILAEYLGTVDALELGKGA